MKLLVTGGTGFVGRALLARLFDKPEYRTLAAVKRSESKVPAEIALVGDLGPVTDWSLALRGVDAVIHAAARAHVMNDGALDPLAAFRAVNTHGTTNLARQAAAAGVRRMVFLSSIKVNGEGTPPGRPYTADDVPAPVDPYGISKHEAEQGLRQVARETGLEIVIIRPVLVYGPGVKANFLSMLRWLHKGVPLPLGAIHNQRSLVALDNLVDLVLTCLHHPNAPNQTFLVSDGQDLSTTALLGRTAAALGTPARLIPVPMQVLWAAARLLGKADLAQRLCGSLQVDISRTREMLGWVPPVSVDEALKLTAQHFLANRC